MPKYYKAEKADNRQLRYDNFEKLKTEMEKYQEMRNLLQTESNTY